MSVGAAVAGDADDPTVERVSIGRTCRPIMWGSVYYRYLDELRALKPTEE
jgi:hypothetical protein